MTQLKFLVAGALLCMLRLAQSADPAYVIVQATDQAATVYIGVSAELPDERLQKLKAHIANVRRMWLVNWADFVSDPDRYLRSYVLRNDYPEIDVVDGMFALLKKYPAQPFGVTWNGGIALTANDYSYARRTMAMYVSNPESFHPPERARDPVNPLNHLGPLLRPNPELPSGS